MKRKDTMTAGLLGGCIVSAVLYGAIGALIGAILFGVARWMLASKKPTKQLLEQELPPTKVVIPSPPTKPPRQPDSPPREESGET